MILLDTHALLWLDRDDVSLGVDARRLIARAWQGGQVGVSAISFWECATLAQRGRIRLPCAVEAWRASLIAAGIVEWPLDGQTALLATTFDDLHRDPADRFIVATAVRQDAVLITADEKLLAWRNALPRRDARR